MRRPRLKLDSGKEEAYYHWMSRAVGAEWLLDDIAKELLREPNGDGQPPNVNHRGHRDRIFVSGLEHAPLVGEVMD